jgi:2-phosphosulfolactate phosphatase
VTAPQDAHRQTDYSLRMDWGSTGAAAISPGCDVAVIIDILSFTTTLTVAADRGTVVFPYRWRDDTAALFAAEHDATLAVGRSQATPGQVSLSPGSIRDAPVLDRLVLPSPNGSTISIHLAGIAADVLGVSLRNRQATAQWLLARRTAHPGLRVAVIAAGERWPDGSLRPAAEDLWGAGALIASLHAAGWTDLSPEAHAAAATYSAIPNISNALADCASGRELIGIGHADDVHTAAQLDTSHAIPALRNGAFTTA